MKTTLFVYIGIWLLVVLPLILFNIKKMFPKIPLVGRKINVKTFAIVILVFIISTTFLYSSYNITINTRYELAAERYITAHCDYLLGNTNSDELKSALSPLVTDDEFASFNAAIYGEYKSATKVEYQLSDWVIPKYFQDVEGFENVNIISEENPVYILYRFKIDDKITDYCLRMVRQADNSWRIDHFDEATDAEYKIGNKNYPKNDVWNVID